MSKRWIVYVDWADGDVEDTDEITVVANTKAQAAVAAVESWVESNEWPTCELQSVTVVDPKKHRELA
jgi:hypothetical protein